MDKAVLDSQHSFFDRHPFPGLDFSHLKNVQQFIYTLEKNDLYRAIKKLLQPNKNLLDVGCGTGEFTTYLSIFNRVEVIGLDYSAETIQWANGVKENFGFDSNLSFLKADIFQISTNELGRFDYALAMGLFPSIPNESTAMQKIVDFVKPGGVVVFGFFDPIGRAYTRLKRWLLQSISSRFPDQEAICNNVLLTHLKDKNEVIWHLNQLTEEFLNYHSPMQARSMMQRCGLTITDCCPKLKSIGTSIPDELNIRDTYKFPFLQFFGRLSWLKPTINGYYVLVGRKA